ncbi:MAG: hypothetical protein AAFZ01_14900 [Pseudomonadota bacterium]
MLQRQASDREAFSPTALFITFGLAGPPLGFVALIAGLAVTAELPEGLGAVAYGLHPLGLALIYVCGLAPALATASLLVWMKGHPLASTIWFPGFLGFGMSLLYGLVGTVGFSLGLDWQSVLALGAIGAFAAVMSILILQLLACQTRKALDGSRGAR